MCLQGAKPITAQNLDRFQEHYDQNPLLRAMSNVLTENSIADIANVHGARSAEQFHFSLEIPTLPAANQKASGRCWIFAGLNVLREKIAKKYNLEGFELSQNYTAFWDKYEKINYMLESIIDLADRPTDDRVLTWVLQVGIQDGGQWDMLVNVIQKYGLVPQSAMVETFQSSNTGRMNHLINRRMSIYAAAIQKMYREGKTRDEIRIEKEKMLDEMYGFLCANFGVPPKTFDFEYTDKDKNYGIIRDLTPMQFLNEYVEGDLDAYVSIINAPTQDKPYNHAYTVDYLGNVVGGKDVLYLNLEMDAMKDLIIRQLQDGEVVWFGSDVGYDGNRKMGVWDDKAFDYETAFGMNFNLTKEDGLNYWRSAMNHAMVITGVNLDENGKPNRWKIENSWGDENGNKGYYLMSDTWFDHYVYQAVVHRKYLSARQLEDLEKEPKHLNPWDPMGSLAD